MGGGGRGDRGRRRRLEFSWLVQLAEEGVVVERSRLDQQHSMQDEERRVEQNWPGGVPQGRGWPPLRLAALLTSLALSPGSLPARAGVGSS